MVRAEGREAVLVPLRARHAGVANRGCIDVGKCLSVKGAEDAINRAFGFELSTRGDTKYFIADSAKEKEEWINSLGRAVVRHSRALIDDTEEDPY